MNGNVSAGVRAALCGVMTALAVVFLMLVPVLPILLYCSPILSGICVALCTEEFGVRYGVSVYAAASVLASLLAADKEAVSVFVLLAGAYPVLKFALQKKPLAVRLLCKLLYINAAGAAYYFLAVLVLGVPKESFGGTIVMLILLAAANVIMLIFDKAIDSMTALYRLRFHNRIFK